MRFAPLPAALLLCGCNWIFGVQAGQPLGDGGSGPLPDGAIYASVGELTAVDAKVDAGEEPWASAWPLFEQDLQAAITLSPLSVVDNGAGASGSDPRAFATDSLSTDCVVGLTNGRHDYCVALAMGHASRDLAIAWVMRRDEAHAERALELIHHFLLDDTTGVRPMATNAGPENEGEGTGSAIEVDLWVPPFVYAASFLRGHPHWDTLEHGEADFEVWLRTWRADAASNAPSSAGGTRYLYHLTAIAAVDAYLEETADLNADIAAMQAYLGDNIDADGLISGAGGSAFFHLEAMTLTAQLAEYHDADLFGFTDADGIVLERAFAAYAPCLVGDAACPFGSTPSAGDIAEGASMTELAHSRYDDPALLQALETVGRPVFDRRVLGWTTLTHGNGFEL